MPILLSVNVGAPLSAEHAALGVTGIDKRPVDHPVEVRAPGPPGVGGSGLVGDSVCNLRVHGGDDRAVSAYAREDLDDWEKDLGRALPCGVFGENMTTSALDVTNALIGERWRVGATVVLEVAMPRIPCGNFAGWLGEQGWVKTFTERAVPGVKMRVVVPGAIRAGDAIEVVRRPAHDVTVREAFQALTTHPEHLPRLLGLDALPVDIQQRVRDRIATGTAAGG
jgi:MOSC domain-containing protein YiiM